MDELGQQTWCLSVFVANICHQGTKTQSIYQSYEIRGNKRMNWDTISPGMTSERM